MSEKLFENTKEINIENLITKINEVVGEKFAILDEKDDIEKWNTLPKLLLLEEENAKKVLSFVEFMDSLLVPKEEKAMYVVSLCGLIEFGNLILKDYEEGSLFTLADYYQNSSIEEIKKTIPIVGDPSLLIFVRYKTLDLEGRKELLKQIVTEAEQKGVHTKNQILKFIETKQQEMQDQYYDEIIQENENR